MTPLRRARRITRLAGRTTASWRTEFGEIVLFGCGYVLLVRWALVTADLPTFVVGGNIGLLDYWRVLGSLILCAGLWRLGWAWSSHEPLRPVWAAAPGACTIAALVPVVVLAFSAWKQALPRLVPFDWDPSFHALSMHVAGRPDWAWFAWVYGFPWLINAIDLFYGPGWVLVMFATTAAMAWSSDTALRRQYALALLATWILLGSVLGAIFGSGGPLLYHLFVTGEDPYAPLRTALAQYPESITSQAASELERVYRSNDWRIGAGISAMPSLHVAQATLTALVVRASAPRWATVGWTGVGLILLASIVLGWHYALDGIVAMILTVLIWRVVASRK